MKSWLASREVGATRRPGAMGDVRRLPAANWRRMGGRWQGEGQHPTADLWAINADSYIPAGAAVHDMTERVLAPRPKATPTAMRRSRQSAPSIPPRVPPWCSSPSMITWLLSPVFGRRLERWISGVVSPGSCRWGRVAATRIRIPSPPKPRSIIAQVTGSGALAVASEMQLVGNSQEMTS